MGTSSAVVDQREPSRRALGMLEEEWDSIVQNPLSSIFILSCITALVLFKLHQLHKTLVKVKKD